MKPKLLFIIAILMAAITTILFYNYLNQSQSETVETISKTFIVVAKERIAANTMLSTDLVELKEVPEEGLHSQVIRDLTQIDGLYVTSPIEAGEPILEHRLQTEQAETHYVSRKIKEGYRAISIGIDTVGSVSNLIEPEDYVDLILSEPDPNDEKKVKTSMLLEKVRVVAIGRRFVDNRETIQEHVEYSQVTLELLPADTIKLVNATQRGTIQLSLHTRLLTPEKNESGELDESTEQGN